MKEGVGAEQLVEACRLLAERGLVTSTSGRELPPLVAGGWPRPIAR